VVILIIESAVSVLNLMIYQIWFQLVMEGIFIGSAQEEVQETQEEALTGPTPGA